MGLVSAVYLLLNFVVVKQGNKTDIWGHIGGLIAGIITTIALSPLENSPERTLGIFKRQKNFRLMGILLSLIFYIGIGVKLFMI
jgi:hypothetical protein